MVKKIFCDVCGKDLVEETPVFNVIVQEYENVGNMAKEEQLWETKEYNLCKEHKEALSQFISKEETEQ